MASFSIRTSMSLVNGAVSIKVEPFYSKPSSYLVCSPLKVNGFSRHKVSFCSDRSRQRAWNGYGLCSSSCYSENIITTRISRNEREKRNRIFQDTKCFGWVILNELNHIYANAGVSQPFAIHVSAVTTVADSGFEAMVVGTARKYYMVGGKGGVGKTSVAASLAVKFANNGHPTLVVSTDPAHSLSDSFAQDVTGGIPVAVQGTDMTLYAMEIDPEKAREEFRAATAGDGGGVKDFMDGMGLGGWVEQLSELKLGELLDTPPPGLDEAVAIAKVVQFVQSPEYSHFTRIVFDTAPTGHTLRLLSLPDFLDASIGKILKLKQKLSSATSAIKSVFGQSEDGTDKAADKLEELKQRMNMVRDIFRDKNSTEFVIVTIPTVMAISESSRLLSSLEKENVPVKKIIINQILPNSPSSSNCKFCNMKRKDQHKAMEMVKEDPVLNKLHIIESPLFDLEIRGVPALKFMGDLIWKN